MTIRVVPKWRVVTFILVTGLAEPALNRTVITRSWAATQDGSQFTRWKKEFENEIKTGHIIQSA